MKYFEIYVGGHDGFSTFVKTESAIPVLTSEDTILELAIKAKAIEPYDAKDIAAGAGDIHEITDFIENYPDVTWNLI